MEIKCHSHTLPRRYKTRKNDPIWPEVLGDGSNPIHNDEADKYPRCNGEVTIKIKAVDEPDWGCTYAALEIEWSCSKCKDPYIPGRYKIDLAAVMNELSLNELIKILEEANDK